MEFALPLIWGTIIATAVIMYVLMDGFDLGVGILFRSRKNERERNMMINSIAPFWDGNETWLVLGGGGLLAAFPLAYALVMPAMYIPVFTMLIALVFRGVAFEFRFKADREHRYLWDNAFSIGSFVATFAQGIILGGFVQGIDVEGRAFAGGPFDWLTPFSLLTGFAVVAGYMLLGATWLIMKTEGELQAWAYKITPWLLGCVLFFMTIVSLWMPFLHSDVPILGARLDAYMQTEIFQRWFGWPNLLFLSWVPIATLVLAYVLLDSVKKKHEHAPFLCTICLFLLGYMGLAISLWPNVVPPSVTLWEAAAAPASQLFLLVGVSIFLPVILGYTAWLYWVFKGKVDGDPHGYGE